MRKVIVFLFVLCLLSTNLPVSALESDQGAIKGWLYIPVIDMAEPLYSAATVDGIYQIPDHDAVHLDGTAWINTTYGDLVRAGGGIAPEGSEYPAGRIVLSGHRGEVFSTLSDVQTGDMLYLAEWPTLIEFEVLSVVTVEFDPDLLAPTSEDQRLTLITCDGDQRLVIEAVRR